MKILRGSSHIVREESKFQRAEQELTRVTGRASQVARTRDLDSHDGLSRLELG
jgi:hypothetical protein